MGARIRMSSGDGHGRRILAEPDREEVYVSKGLGRTIARDIGRATTAAARSLPPGNNRRSMVQGGGLAFVARTAQSHPFGVAFGGTLIALRTIKGKTVTSI